MKTDQSAILLSKVDSFLRDTGMGVSYFGKRAVGNSELVSRLRNGRPVLQHTAARVVDFIRSERKRRNLPEGSAGADAA